MPSLNVQVGWSDTEACDGKRIERYVLALEFEVWEESGLTRQQVQEAIFDVLPWIVPDKGGEGAELQSVEAANLPSFYATQRQPQRSEGSKTDA